MAVATPKAAGKTIAPPAAAPILDQFPWQVMALALLVFAAYANSLTSSFHFDDAVIFQNAAILSPGLGLDLFRVDQTRPLTYLTFHWNYLADGENPALYHLVNLVLHAANSILLLVLARRYVPPFAAVCAALVFALHPLQTESVTYVFARSTLLCTHLALWTVWLCARGKYAASAIAFGVSLLAKEEAIALPGLLLLLELYERRRPKWGYFAALTGFAALAAGRLFYIIFTWRLDPGVGRVRGVSTGHYLLTQFRVLWTYLRLMIAPVGLNLDRDVAMSTSLLHPWTTLVAGVALGALLAVLARLAWRKQPAALWALGFFLLIAPSSSIVAQADMMFEHRTYLPMVCAAIGMAFLFTRVRRARLITLFAILVPAMLAGTMSRNEDWHDEKTFWSDIATKSPNKGRAWLGLARAYASDPVKEFEYLRRGLVRDPENPELHTNYGIALFARKRFSEALEHFNHAMGIAGETADGWNNIGGAYFQLNQPADSLRSFEKALQLDPCNFNARRNVMMLHSQENDPHGVWVEGELPTSCTMLPDQARSIDALRHQAGKP